MAGRRGAATRAPASAQIASPAIQTARAHSGTSGASSITAVVPSPSATAVTMPRVCVVQASVTAPPRISQSQGSTMKSASP